MGGASNTISQGYSIVNDPCKSAADFNFGSLLGSAVAGGLTAGRSSKYGNSTAAQVGTAAQNFGISAGITGVSMKLGSQ